MSAMRESIEKHHRLIILVLGLVIVFFLLACTLHDVIPVCHWLFKCDHRLHSEIQLMSSIVL